MNDDSIAITFQLTIEDYAKFSADTACGTKGVINSIESAKQCVRILPILLAVFIVCLIFDFYKEDISSFHDYFSSAPNRMLLPLFIFLCFFTLLVCLYNSGQYSRCQKFARSILMTGDNKQILSPSELVISRDGVLSRSEYSETTTKWSGVEKVIIQNGDLCIFLSSLSAYCIPVRFFSSREELRNVYDKCVYWYELEKRSFS